MRWNSSSKSSSSRGGARLVAPAERAPRRREADRAGPVGARPLRARFSAFALGDGLQDRVDDLVGLDALGLALEVEQDAVAERRVRRPRARRRRSRRSARRRARGSSRRAAPPARRAASCRSARSASPRSGASGPSGCVAWSDADRVVLHVPRDGHLPHELLHLEDVVAVEHGAARLDARRPSCRSRIAWSSSRFGNGTWSLKKKRSSCASGSGYVPSISSGFCVARTTNGSSSTCVRLPTRDAVLLHRLEQRALRLRRRAVHLVGEHDVREDGALAELERLRAALRLVDDRRAEDVGRHEVRRELDARERERQRLGQRAHEHRLAEARHALEQRVPAGEHARDDAVDDLALPTIAFAISVAQLVDPLAEARDLLPHRLGLGHLTTLYSLGVACRHSSRGRMSWK